jgi:hydrogenase expression/formation protein HypD
MSLGAAAEYLRNYSGPPLKIMEVCGTHTAAIFKSGVRSLLAPGIRLVSGPGCPVCVTPSSYIDRCVEYASEPGFTLMSFGDMMKTPGSGTSIGGLRAGGRVEMMYSPMEAVERASMDASTTYVVAAVGFETTMPAYALAIEEAEARRLKNLRLLTALKSVTPALEWILENEGDIDGFICPGHVSVITGPEAYEKLAAKYGKPFVVAGFEGEHILAAIYAIARLACGREGGAKDGGRVLNLYPSAVRAGGNARALALISKYFEAGPAVWRGLGRIEGSGRYLREEYARFDGGGRGLDGDAALAAGCACGSVTAGRVDPDECPMFGKSCRPESPLGPCMVSSEGACGVWFQNM